MLNEAFAVAVLVPACNLTCHPVHIKTAQRHMGLLCGVQSVQDSVHCRIRQLMAEVAMLTVINCLRIGNSVFLAGLVFS